MKRVALYSMLLLAVSVSFTMQPIKQNKMTKASLLEIKKENESNIYDQDCCRLFCAVAAIYCPYIIPGIGRVIVDHAIQKAL